MNRILYITLLLCILFASCSRNKNGINTKVQFQAFQVHIDTLTLLDRARSRQVPIALYSPKTDKKIRNQKVILFSHGYGQNKGGDYLKYSYLTEHLASKGNFVVSIQHELSTDSLIPITGNPQKVRRPFWEKGADNIMFVINELKKTYPQLAFNKIILIGHSNGGDMSALFPLKYPNVVEGIITLDNRRMSLPKIKKVKVLSLRSCDQPADQGVVPSAKEQKKFGIQIIKLPNTTHNNMDDHASPVQRKEINDHIVTFLNN